MEKKINEIINYIIPYGYVKHKLTCREYFGEESTIAPGLFNEFRQKMNIWYLQDRMCAHTPYTLVAGRFPQRVLWDRFNKGLPIHFYTHDEMYYTSELCQKKYGILRESEVIVPQDYERAFREKAQLKEFNKIFTHSARILDQFENAVFAPANGVWYGTERNGGMMDESQCERKSKYVSMVSSDKMMCSMHKIRIAIARHCMCSNKVDVYGKVSGSYIAHKADALTDYRYSIAIENDTTPYYFTEKILDCFASMTVPIYIGATEIGKFFNLDGIIQVKKGNEEEIDRIIKNCCEQDYEERLPAVKDNYHRVMKYLCVEDYITNNYEI